MDSQLVRGIPDWAQNGSVYIKEDSSHHIYGSNEVFVGSHPSMAKNRLNELLMYVHDQIPEPNVVQVDKSINKSKNNKLKILQIESKYCGRIYTITEESRIYNVDNNMNKIYIGSNYGMTNNALKKLILSILRADSTVYAKVDLQKVDMAILSESVKCHNDDIIKLQDDINNANIEISNLQEYLIGTNNMDVIGDDDTTNDIINLQADISSIRLDISLMSDDRANDANTIASIQEDAKRKLDIIYNLNESVKNLTAICKEQSDMIDQLKTYVSREHVSDVTERAIALHQKYPNLNIMTTQFEIIDGLVVIH